MITIIFMSTVVVIGLVSIYILHREPKWDLERVHPTLRAAQDMAIMDKTVNASVVKRNKQYSDLMNYKV